METNSNWDPPNFSFYRLAPSGKDARRSDLSWTPGLPTYLPSHSAHWQVQLSTKCDRMFATVASECIKAISECYSCYALHVGDLWKLGASRRFPQFWVALLTPVHCKTIRPAVECERSKALVLSSCVQTYCPLEVQLESQSAIQMFQWCLKSLVIYGNSPLRVRTLLATWFLLLKWPSGELRTNRSSMSPYSLKCAKAAQRVKAVLS